MATKKVVRLHEDELVNQNPAAAPVEAAPAEVANAQAAPVEAAPAEAAPAEAAPAEVTPEGVAETTPQAPTTPMDPLTPPDNSGDWIPSGWVKKSDLAAAVAQVTGDVEAASTAPDAEVTEAPLVQNPEEVQAAAPVVQESLIREAENLDAPLGGMDKSDAMKSDKPVEKIKPLGAVGGADKMKSDKPVEKIKPLASVGGADEMKKDTPAENTNPLLGAGVSSDIIKAKNTSDKAETKDVYDMPEGDELADDDVDRDIDLEGFFDGGDDAADENLDLMDDADTFDADEADEFEKQLNALLGDYNDIENPTLADSVNLASDSMSASLDFLKSVTSGMAGDATEDADFADEDMDLEGEDDFEGIDDTPDFEDADEAFADEDAAVDADFEDADIADDQAVEDDADADLEAEDEEMDEEMAKEIEEAIAHAPKSRIIEAVKKMTGKQGKKFLEALEDEDPEILMEDIKFPAGSEHFANEIDSEGNLIEECKARIQTRRNAIQEFRKRRAPEPVRESFREALNKPISSPETAAHNEDANAWCNNKFEARYTERKQLNFRELLSKGLLG